MNNIVRHELRAGLKPFLFWVLGLCFLIIGGMTKFLGFNGATGMDINVLLGQFPKIFLAMFGIANLDIQTLRGFYAVLENYALICTSLFAIHIGLNAVSGEAIDKTYEFLFTKPRSRIYILTSKLSAGGLYLIAFCIFHLIFSFAALRVYGIENTIQSLIISYTLNLLLVGFVFFSLAAMLSALMARAELGASISYAVFGFAYVLSVLFDLLENTAFIKPFTPLRYFEATDLIAGQFDILYLGVCLVLYAVFLASAYRAFYKRDLGAL